MLNRGEIPYGWILILAGLVIASTSLFIQVGHFEAGYYATIDNNPQKQGNLSEFPAECQQLAHHLADGQNASEEAYVIQIGGTTHAVKHTTVSNRAVEGGDVRGGGSSDWHLGDTFCGNHIDLGRTYGIDGEYYEILGWRHPSPNFWYRQGVVLLPLLTGISLLLVGRRLRRRSDSPHN